MPHRLTRHDAQRGHRIDLAPLIPPSVLALRGGGRRADVRLPFRFKERSVMDAKICVALFAP